MAFGAFYRARAARSSAQEAVVATAHKIARVIYHMLRRLQRVLDRVVTDGRVAGERYDRRCQRTGFWRP